MPEMLIGLIVAGLAITVTLNAYVMVSQMWKDDLVMNELSRNANIGIEKMLHGAAGSLNSGLLAAKSISSPVNGVTANSVSYVDSNDVSRIFYCSGGRIYAAEGVLPTGGIVMLSDVVSVTPFSRSDPTVWIRLALRKASGSKWINLSVETRVSPRN